MLSQSAWLCQIKRGIHRVLVARRRAAGSFFSTQQPVLTNGHSLACSLEVVRRYKAVRQHICHVRGCSWSARRHRQEGRSEVWHRGGWMRAQRCVRRTNGLLMCTCACVWVYSMCRFWPHKSVFILLHFCCDHFLSSSAFIQTMFPQRKCAAIL